MNGAPRREWISVGFSIVAAFVWAFFVAFNAVFSDAFGVSQYVGLMGYVLAAYAVLGTVFGLIWPGKGWRWTFWLSWPAAFALGLYSFSEPQQIGWHAVVIVLAFVGASIGAAVGAGARRSRDRS